MTPALRKTGQLLRQSLRALLKAFATKSTLSNGYRLNDFMRVTRTKKIFLLSPSSLGILRILPGTLDSILGAIFHHRLFIKINVDL